MAPSVGIIAPGNMGAGIGGRLVEHGVEVWTSLEGRSAKSAARAAAAGMRAAPESRLAVDIVLSILPPSEALGLARRLAPALAAAAAKPIYVDCNAVSPDTALAIAAAIEPTGCRFVDGGIIGGPPQPGKPGPRLYVSGPDARAVAELARHGLDVKVLDAPIGAASALKMSYAGITKGLVALASTIALAATRNGADRALYEELAESQPALLGWLGRHLPGMYDKAYRWAGEMREIADYVGEDEAGRDLYTAMADLYERLARDASGPRREIAQLDRFMKRAAREAA
jgi:putative dehydrogenase